MLLIATVIAIGIPHPRAKSERTKLVIGNIESALKLYHARRGEFPASATGLEELVRAGILNQLPKDAWGNDYHYELVDGVPAITSYGADGTLGGTGNDSDISNRAQTVARGKP
jgi:general secretion pathway protein G